jgi:hypothetical protein
MKSFIASMLALAMWGAGASLATADSIVGAHVGPVGVGIGVHHHHHRHRHYHHHG